MSRSVRENRRRCLTALTALLVALAPNASFGQTPANAPEEQAKTGPTTLAIGRSSVTSPQGEATTTFTGSGGGIIEIIDEDGKTRVTGASIIKIVPSTVPRPVTKFTPQEIPLDRAERRRALIEKLKNGQASTASPRVRPRGGPPAPPKARGAGSAESPLRTRVHLNPRRSTGLQSGARP